MKIVVAPKVTEGIDGEQKLIGAECDLGNYMLCWPQ